MARATFGLAVVFALAAALAGTTAPASAETNYGVTAVIAIDDGFGPQGVVVNPATDTVYVADSTFVGPGINNRVLVIDARTNTVVHTIDGGGIIGVDPSTNTIYAAGLNTLSVIDGATDAVIAIIADGSNGQQPVALAVDSSTHVLYVANQLTSSISVIDTTTDTMTATIDVGGTKGGLSALAVDPATNTIYAANTDDGTVSVIDGSTDTVMRTIDVTRNPMGTIVDRDPMGVAVDPTTDTLYVADYRSVSVINGATDTVTDTIEIGADGQAVAVDPSTHTIYVSRYSVGTVVVIDGTTDTMIAKVSYSKSAPGPSTVAVNPTTHTAYVTNNFGGTLAVIGPVLGGSGSGSGPGSAATTTVAVVSGVTTTIPAAILPITGEQDRAPLDAAAGIIVVVLAGVAVRRRRRPARPRAG